MKRVVKVFKAEKLKTNNTWSSASVPTYQYFHNKFYNRKSWTTATHT